MKVTCDPEVDVLRILFRYLAIEESAEDKPCVMPPSAETYGCIGVTMR